MRRAGTILVLVLAGCRAAPLPVDANGLRVTAVHIGKATFTTEIAGTVAEQAKGLMYRTRIAPDEAMLFWPYPADVGGKPQPPRIANFWMKDTPSPLDIIFIRADGTIAHIAENAVPMDETPLGSGEPVAAVLEIAGGRAAELGIAEGAKVVWAK